MNAVFGAMMSLAISINGSAGAEIHEAHGMTNLDEAKTAKMERERATKIMCTQSEQVQNLFRDVFKKWTRSHERNNFRKKHLSHRSGFLK